MRFVMKVDKDDIYKSADIKDLSSIELLVINSALRRYARDETVHESDRAVADRIGMELLNGDAIQNPLESIDGADLTDWRESDDL